MAKPKTMSGTQLVIQLGDGGGTEVFAATCLINSDRSIEFSADTNDQVVPDCASPDAPAWVERSVDSFSAGVSGAGVVDTAELGNFWTWFSGGLSKNIRVKLNNVILANGGGHWAFAAKLTGFTITGNRGQKATFECTIQSDGVVSWVPAAA